MRPNKLIAILLIASLPCTWHPSPSHAQATPDIAATAPADAVTKPPAASLEDDPRMAHWRLVFFWSLVILLIFLVAALVIVRFSERYKAYLLRKRRPPTPSDDVWKMHKLPREMDIDLPHDDSEDRGN